LAFVESELKKSARRARRGWAKRIEKTHWNSLRKTIEAILRDFRSKRSPPSSEAWQLRVAKAEDRASDRYSHYWAEPNIENLHELRIRLKQWRYLLELAPQGPEERRKIGLLKSLQDDIGELHDRETLRDLLKTERMNRVAHQEKAGHDLREIRQRLKAEIEAGQNSFLARQSQALAEIFPEEKE